MVEETTAGSALSAKPGVDAVDPEESEWRLGEGERLAPGLIAIKLLGGGSRYEAYLAWDESRRSFVVVKMLRPGLVADEHALRGLRGEVEMLGSLQHPVIVRHFDAQIDGARPHIVLEQVEGPRLSTLLRRYGPLAPEQAVQLALQLLAAAHYMTESGVVHLDIKPSNIIMAGPPRLIDLSVARTVDRARELTDPVGTDDYMAPEQCMPTGNVGPAADVWGIGVTLYEALTGELPFPEGNPDATDPADQWPQTVQVATAPAPQVIDTPWIESMMDCLRSDASQRPTPAILAATLEPVLEELAGLRVSRLKPRLRQRAPHG